MSQVIMITGASSGMGKDFALALLKKGHMVYGLARRVEKMQDIVQAGGKAIAMDITDEAQVQSAVEQVIREKGRVDVLINNAGYAVYGPVEEVPIDKARRQFEVNMFGLASITQKVLPHMRERGSGRIINISSMGGKVYTPMGAWYHATKHALEGWSDCLRVELMPFGIDVVIIEPGGIATEFTDVFQANLQGDSENGPYASGLQSIIQSTKQMASQLSPPSVITKLILRAVHSKRPKTRYVAGAYAKPLIFMRKYLSDRMFDRILNSQFQKPPKQLP
ncbi:MAG: SDR family NAD(P)-dependent oxidoreductase [Deltaproteobacteria bacterium]|nr:MAG: SDR family NAD(P)-dependent oxidoreductase [Deltaproteobacteria bacterium]